MPLRAAAAAEMNAGMVLTLGVHPAILLTQLLDPADGGDQPRPDAVTVGRCSDKIDLQPVIAVAQVAKQLIGPLALPVSVGDEQVHESIPVEIDRSHVAAQADGAALCAARIGHDSEGSVAQVLIEQVGLVGRPTGTHEIQIHVMSLSLTKKRLGHRSRF